MSDAFIWRDREGVEHHLDRPDLIEAEDVVIAAELDALMPDLAAADDRAFLDAFAIARPLRLRAARLAEDLARWDKHATALIIAESDAAVVAIARLVAKGAELSALHKIYDDFEAVYRAGDTVTRNGPPSAAQRAAIAAACARLEKPQKELSTFDAAQAWLVNEPTTNRVTSPQRHSSFEWADRHGHIHQLRSIRPIEEEYIAFASELGSLVDDLSAETIETRRMALVRGVPSFQRISILERNMAAWSADAIKLARTDVAEWFKAKM